MELEIKAFVVSVPIPIPIPIPMPRFTNGHEKICNKHDRCRLVTPKWFEKILEYNPGEKLLKVLFAIYLDLGCLLKNEQSCEKILKNCAQ